MGQRGAPAQESLQRATDGQAPTGGRSAPAAEAAKKYGVSDQTIYIQRKRFGTLQADEIKRLRGLEQENARLKKLVAEGDLAIEVMKEISAKKW